jgi:hypothetical protein
MVDEIWWWLVKLWTMILLLNLSMKGGELDEIYMHFQNTNKKGMLMYTFWNKILHVLKLFTCELVKMGKLHIN